MNIEKLRKLRKAEVCHSVYTFAFEGAPSWIEFMTNLGKQLDKLEVSLKDVSKIIWEDGSIKLHCMKVWTVDENKKLTRID